MTASPTRPRARRMQPEARRRQIVEEARAVALELGLHAVSRRTLAGRLGIASALVGHYVTSMEDLVAETFQAISAQELAEVREAAELQTTRTGALRVVLSNMLDGERDAVTAVWADGWSIGRKSRVLAQTVYEQMREWERFVGGILSSGVGRGEFREVEVSPLTREVMGMIDGLNAQALVRRRANAIAAREAKTRKGLVARVLAMELGVDIALLA